MYLVLRGLSQKLTDCYFLFLSVALPGKVLKCVLLIETVIMLPVLKLFIMWKLFHYWKCYNINFWAFVHTGSYKIH